MPRPLSVALNRSATAGYRTLMARFRADEFDNPWLTSADWTYSLSVALYLNAGTTLAGWKNDEGLSPFATLDYTELAVLCWLKCGVVTENDVSMVHRVLRRYAGMAERAGHAF
jgi:hypothetical protein